MDGPTEPEQGLTIVSMLHLTDGIQYRLVGSSAEGHPAAEPARPSLEDGSVWLMQGATPSPGPVPPPPASAGI